MPSYGAEQASIAGKSFAVLLLTQILFPLLAAGWMAQQMELQEMPPCIDPMNMYATMHAVAEFVGMSFYFLS